MKTKIALLALAVASFTAQANNGNKVQQQQIDELRASLHQVHMNTLQKYSESWGLEDRANIAKLQETKLDKSVFAADQQRQDKALVNTITTQAATDSKQTSDLKSYADKKATSAYQTSVAHTDVKVARADADRKKGDDALQGQITSNLSSQAERDAGQDTHINAVQDAAQSANEKADGLAVRADTADKAHAVTDNRSINNAVRLDGVEQVNDQQNVAISTETDSRIAGDSYVNSRVDAANAYIEANRQASVATNKRVAAHSKQLANHETRIQGLENDSSNLRKEMNDNKQKADAAVAGVAAMANIPQVTESARFSAGVGVGTRGSQQAIAVGMSSRLSQSVVGKLSVASDTESQWTAGAGLSIQW